MVNRAMVDRAVTIDRKVTKPVPHTEKDRLAPAVVPVGSAVVAMLEELTQLVLPK